MSVVGLLIVYSGCNLTPSAYRSVLRSLGVKDTGIVAGEPLSIRSDEFSVWTTYTQIAVRNGFERIDKTSLYGEDLRNFNTLPLNDSAMAFKPQFWGFHGVGARSRLFSIMRS